jgi:tRNA(Ile)-lysidine synthase TilS/MesJ
VLRRPYTAASTRSCIRCLLPDTMPGLGLDPSGKCRFCRNAPSAKEMQAERIVLRKEMDDVIARLRGAKPYEAVVAFSGGKDSSYTLKLLVETYGMRVIAVTIDNGFLGAGTMDNCRAVCGSLGVDHVLFTPDKGFMQSLYRRSAVDETLHSAAASKRASSICSSCIAMINTHMLQKAQQLGAPIVAGGYIGGQVPRDGAVMSVVPGQQARIRSPMVNRFASALGDVVRPYFELPEGDCSLREITVINPMLGLALTEAEILAALEPLGWIRPVDTGITSTNCRLNDLGVFIHSNRHGFHPYALEIAEQLRAGTMSLEEGREKLDRLPSRADVTDLAAQVGLTEDEY